MIDAGERIAVRCGRRGECEHRRVEILAVAGLYSAFKVFELGVLFVRVVRIEAVRRRAGRGLASRTVLEDCLDVSLVADVVAELGDRAVPRDRPVLIDVEVAVI